MTWLLRSALEQSGIPRREANNYALSLRALRRFEEAKSLLRKMIPVARRVLGHNSMLTFAMRTNYARALFGDDAATLDDLREAATTLEDTARTARRVLGSSHPTTEGIEDALRLSRAPPRCAREEGDMDSLPDAMAAMSPPGSA